MSESFSTETLSSESSAEHCSSESSLTGISFSSSSEGFSICHEIDRDAITNIAMKDFATTMPANRSLECLLPSTEDDLEYAASGVSHVKGSESANLPSGHSLLSEETAKVSDRSDLVRIESIELLLEDSNENLNSDMLVTSVKAPSKQFPIPSKASEEISSPANVTTYCSDEVEKPRKHIMDNGDSETMMNNNQNKIRHLQEALQQKTESEDLWKQRLESLKIELNSANNNSDYWFNQCVKKREKIEQLLNGARDMNASNFELRQEINNKSKIINEKDQEIQRLKESKTETELLMQEVTEQLSKANKETERLKMLVRNYEDEKLRSVHANQIPQVKSLKPSQVFTKREKTLESQKYKGKINGSSYTTHKGKENNTISGRDGKVLVSEVNYPRLSADTKPPSQAYVKEESTVSENDLKSKCAALDENGAASSGVSSSSQDSPLTTRYSMSKDPEKTKKAIREWLSEVIRQAKTTFSRERKFVSYNEGVSKDGRHAASEKESARCSLREVVSSLKEKISKDVPQQRTKNLSYSTRTSKDDTQGARKSSKDAPYRFYEWNRKEKEKDDRSFFLLPTHAKDKSRVKMAADVSTGISDSMEPFSDVFLTDFQSIEASLADGIDSVEPFGDVFIPWQEDAKTKQTTEAVEPTVTINRKRHDTKVQLGESLFAKDKKSIASEEKRAAAHTAGIMCDRPQAVQTFN